MIITAQQPRARIRFSCCLNVRDDAESCMTSCVVLNELNNSSGNNRTCFALATVLVIGWIFTVFIAEGREFWIVSRSEYKIWSVVLATHNEASCSFVKVYCTTTTQHNSHTHSCPRASRKHAMSRYVMAIYVTSMNLMHSLMVYSKDLAFVDVPVHSSFVTGSVFIHNRGLMGNGYGTE